MKRKITAIALCAVMFATAIIGGTLAYFTDVDQNTNEFAVGNVKIDLYEDVKQTDGADKVAFDLKYQGKGDDTNPNVKYENIQPGSVMTKIAHVENTGKNDAYVALVVKHEGYYDFNQKYVDGYYEDKTQEKWNEMGIYLPDGTAYENKTVMQKITDDVFPNWNLLYDKTQLADPQIRYTMDALPTSDDAGVKVLGVGYAQANADMSGKAQYHYRGEYFTNVLGQKEVIENEPDFFTISKDGAHDRVWIVYLQLAPGAVFDMDLTTVCPTYFDETSAQAFEGMNLDIKAFAIQSAGFESKAEGQKAAFAEALKPGFDF